MLCNRRLAWNKRIVTWSRITVQIRNHHHLKIKISLDGYLKGGESRSATGAVGADASADFGILLEASEGETNLHTHPGQGWAAALGRLWQPLLPRVGYPRLEGLLYSLLPSPISLQP